MNQINLLPVNIGVKTATLKAVGILRQVAITALIIFLLLGGGALAYFLIVNRQITTILTHQENLKAALEGLATQEQQYVLVKDRVKKIDQITQETPVAAALIKIDQLLGTLPLGITVSEIEIKKDTTEITLTASSSRDVVSFFNALITNGIYQKVVLKNFGFNPSTGFLISLETL